MTKILNKIKNLNKNKKSVVALLVAFVTIVGGLVGTSVYLNGKANDETMKTYEKDASSKVILKTDSEDVEETLKDLEYEKLGSNIYLVDYGSSKKAENAVYLKENQESNSEKGITVNEDAIFETASNEDTTIDDEIKQVEQLPEGMSIREYADSLNKKVVAIIDTGVNYYATQSVDFTGSGVEDKNGHGTMVAATIMENANDSAVILSLKAMDDDGMGYMSNIMKAVQYAKDQHVDVINMSIAASDNGGADIFKDLVKDTIADGIQVVAAAGNYNSSSALYIPANIEGVISVGTVDEDGNKTDESNYGDITYYEKADSTSNAAAMITGKLVAGEDLSKEVTKDTVKIDEKKITSSIISQVGYVTEKEDKSKEFSTFFKVNYSNEALSEIYKYSTETVITGEKELVHQLGYGHSIYDSVYGVYHTVFDTKEEGLRAEDDIVSLGYSCYVETIDSKTFKVQTEFDAYGDSNWYRSVLNVWGNGSYSFRVEAPAGYFTSRGISYSVTVGNDVNKSSGTYTCSKGGSVTLTSKSLNLCGTLGVSFSTAQVGTWQQGKIGTSGSGTYYGAQSCAFTYTLSYNGNGGTAPAAQSITNSDKEKTFTISDNSTRTGYTFNGWDKAYWKGGTIKLTGNKTVKADWIAKTYKLFLDRTSGTGNNTKTSIDVIYDSGSNNNVAGYIPTKTGYTFLGFYTSAQNASQMISGTTVGTQVYNAAGACTNQAYFSGNIWKYDGSATVYAQWKANSYTVTVNLNDSDGAGGIKANSNGVNSSTVKSSVVVTYDTSNNNNIGKATRKGYVLDGYYTAASGGTKVFDKNGAYINDGTLWKDNKWYGIQNYTVYAHWTPTTFSVKYENNTSRHVRNGKNIPINTYTSDTTQRVEGSVADDTSVTFDKSYSLANNTLSWAGHDWLGWNESSEATSGYSNQQNFSYAQIIENNGRYWDYTNECWKDSSGKKVDTVTLYSIWNARQHSITIVPTSENNDALQEESFTGSWSGTNNGTSVATNGSNSITLTAYWGDKIVLGKAVPSAGHTRTIRYDVNGENVNIDRTSDTVSLYFNRWNYESKDNNIGNRANDIIYDNGTDNAYLTVQDQNSTIVARYYFDTVVLPTPTREGYNFLGWYYDAATTQKATGKNNCRGNGGSIYRTANNETLYARWEQTSYNYSETMEPFIQDETDDKPHVYMSKLNGNTNTTLTKVKNSVTGEMVGFTIQLYKNSISSENLVLTLKTDQGVFDKNGDILINYQNDGRYEITNYLEKNVTYVVHEIDPPNGWSLDLDKEVMFDGEHNLEITMEDTPFVSPGGDLLKLDSYGRPLEGAFFKLVEGNSYNENANVILEFTTNEEGKSGYDIYKYCKAGKTYTLHEVKAPEGYELCEDYTFKMPMYSIESLILIQAEDVTKLVKSLKIVKVDSEDNPLSGAEFQLYMKDSNGNLVECYVDSNGDWANVADLTDAQIKEKGYELMKGTTGSDGTVTFNNLPVRASFTGGESNYTKAYYLKETKAPEGYSLLTETFEILIPEDATNKEITYVVKDDSIMLTLEAGGNGYSLYVGLGASLIALAIALSLTKKTKRA